jgi:peptide/nickel transport system substrate-binding protein
MLLLAVLLAACGSQTGGTGGGTGGAGGQTNATTSAGGAAGGAASATTNAGGETAGAAATAGGNADASGAQGNATINISLSADPPKLDPALSSALVDRQVFNSLFDKLVDLDAQGKIVPMLATAWKMSDDNLTYTFTLRDGVKFHDGTDFNADAVKFNLERGMAEASPRRTELQAVKSIDVVDPKTIKVTLKAPFAPFLSVLTDRAGMIVSPKAAKEMGDQFLTKPIGTGPFKFQDRVKGDHITLVRNENYWQQGLPKAAKIVFKVFTDANTALVNLRSGQVDFTDTLPSKEVPNVKQDQKFAVVNQPGFGFQGIWLNVKQPPLDKKEVREAISMLINRDSLVKVMFGETATPGNSPFAPSQFAFGEGDKYDKPNVEQAKALLAKAGASNVSFTLKTGTSAANAQLAQLVQNFVQPAGIKMQIEKVEFGTLLDQMDKGNFQAAQIGWSGRPDPDQNAYDWFTTGGGNNNGGYSNPQVDELMKQARAESDEAKRKAAYEKAMQLIHDDAPYVFLYHPNNIFGMSANVTGFTYVPDGIIRTVNLSKKQ